MHGTATLFVDKGQYWVKHTTSLPPVGPVDRDDGTLVYASATAEDGGLFITPGTFDGPVDVTVEVGDDITEQDPGAWEIVNDVEVQAVGNDLIIATTDDVYGELPRIELPPGSRFAVRLFARGVTEARKLGEIDPDEIAMEQHILQIRVL